MADAGVVISAEDVPVPTPAPPPAPVKSRKRSAPSKKSSSSSSSSSSTKRRASSKGFFLVSGCMGVACAADEAKAREIAMAETGDASVIPLSLEQAFCYPVSFGSPEQLPPDTAPTAAGSALALFCAVDYDLGVPGTRGVAFVVARDGAHATELVDAYLTDCGRRTSAEAPYEVVPIRGTKDFETV